MRLADYATIEDSWQLQDVLNLILNHAADRDASPVGHHLCHYLLVYVIDHSLFRIARLKRRGFRQFLLRKIEKVKAEWAMGRLEACLFSRGLMGRAK